jgi:predicted AAA+ superfamily ATPase
MYIVRHLEGTVKRVSKMFPALIITGARQVGKTWLLREMYPGLPYITLDDPVWLRAAQNDPGSVFRQVPPPVVLDEIQYAPGLFPLIKMIADGVYPDGTGAPGAKPGKSRGKGLFFMSGSQQFSLMKNVTESLAGRVGILSLLGLSRRETTGDSFSRPFLPTGDYFEGRNPRRAASRNNIWETIQRGCLPEMVYPETDWELFYSAYVRTYIERDVRQLVNIGDEIAFLNFLTAMAARSGQLLNYAALSRETGVSLPTVERWTSMLRASNLIYLLQPYHNNVLKRALKTPKVYFLDTGLVCYLTRWTDPVVLERGAAAGHLFETYCMGEIIKSYTNAGREPPLFFYRDKEQNEIDLLIQENGILYPLEIKKHADPKPADIKSFRFLDKLPGAIRGPGGVICLYPDLAPLGGDDRVIPLEYI